MKIIVCVKQVPDTSGKVAVNPDGTLNRASMQTITNPDDMNAVEAALKLKDATGCKVIVITSHGQSPLAGEADACLCGMGREVQYTSEAGASRLIHMAIGDVLYTRIAMQEEGLFRDNIKKMRQEIGKKRQL